MRGSESVKRSLGLGLGVFLLTETASAALVPYRAVLDGKQVVPPRMVAATGEAEVQYDDETRTLVGTITYVGLTGVPTGADLHNAACGESGAVMLSLSDAGATDTAVNVTLTEAQGAELASGNLYVAVRTPTHADGEIRGQFYFPRPPKTCPPTVEGEIDAGSSSGGPSAGGPSPGGPSPGATWDAGDLNKGAAPSDDGGCSTSGEAPGAWFFVALALAFGYRRRILR